MVLGTEPGCLRFRRCAKGNGKLGGCEGTPGAGLTELPFRKALPEMLAFKPYWGEPTVRDFRGDDGNVGIIRSPVRAIVLPDHWSYPYRKGLEIYNQDQLVLDQEAGRQARAFGLVLVEGFFDVAKLVEAGCRNAGALMGAHISAEQIERLSWLRSRIGFSRVVLFLDRDEPGRNGARQAYERLRQNDFEAKVFDWDRTVLADDRGPEPIPASIQDPADMSVEQLQRLRGQGVI